MAAYRTESALRTSIVEIIRGVAPSCIGLELVRLPAPFRPGNWHIGKLDVLVQDYGAARDKADELAALRDWIAVPDDHWLDGQVYGQERAR